MFVATQSQIEEGNLWLAEVEEKSAFNIVSKSSNLLDGMVYGAKFRGTWVRFRRCIGLKYLSDIANCFMFPLRVS